MSVCACVLYETCSLSISDGELVMEGPVVACACVCAYVYVRQPTLFIRACTCALIACIHVE